jgi:type I site-specific restriction-modification system R (restriction) subunit
MADPKDPKVAIATKQINTEVVVGAAAADLKKGIIALGLMMEGINKLPEEVEKLELKISAKRTELTGLEQQFTESERQRTVELDINMKEKGIKAADDLLEKAGKVSIAKDELATLKKELSDLKASYQSDLKEGVQDARNSLTIEHDNKTALADALHKQNEAQNTAKITGLEFQIEQLKSTNEMLIKQLDAEREAGIKRAEAAKPAPIQIGQPGQR